MVKTVTKLIKTKIEFVLFYPIVLFARVLFRYLPVFHGLRITVLSTKGRESLLISYLEPYLRDLQNNPNTGLKVLIVNPTKEKEYNRQLLKMYKRVVTIIDRENPVFVYFLSTLHRLLPNSSPNKVILRSCYTKDHESIWVDHKPSIALSYKEVQTAISLENEKNINLKKDFICLGVREDSYYENISRLTSEYGSISSQTFVRNPNINTYVKALERIASDKIHVFRMGLFLNNKINTNSQYFIDQAKFDHNDLLDIHMLSNCKFVISGASGLWWFASLFNKPSLVVDFYPFVAGGGVKSEDMYIPQLVWSIAKKRLLTFSEIIRLGKKLYFYDFLKNNQLELIKNSEDEIYEGSKEIISNIDNNQYLVDAEKVKKLSNILFSLKKQDNNNISQHPGKISSYFITKYEHLVR